MAKVDFYLIDKPRFREQPLLLVCELCKKAFAAQLPTLVYCASQEQAEELDALLWEFEEDSFLPHQICGEPDDDVTAIVLVPPGMESPMRHLVINLRDEVVPRTAEMIKEVVAAEPDQREGSRRRWREYQQRGDMPRKLDM